MKWNGLELPPAYYSDDAVYIIHGDCREVLPLIPDKSIDLVLTDPPYGSRQDLNYARRKRGGDYLKGTTTIAKDWDECIGDSQDFNPTFLLSYKQVIIWGANYFSDKLPINFRWLIWDKRNGVASDDNADCEIAWTNLKGVSRIYRQLWKGICREGRENIAIQHEKLHPFQKPVSLMAWCILQGKGVNMILDPFTGSGTTIVASKELNRKCIGIEIEEDYCRIAAQRCAQSVLPLEIEQIQQGQSASESLMFPTMTPPAKGNKVRGEMGLGNINEETDRE